MAQAEREDFSEGQNGSGQQLPGSLHDMASEACDKSDNFQADAFNKGDNTVVNQSAASDHSDTRDHGDTKIDCKQREPIKTICSAHDEAKDTQHTEPVNHGKAEVKASADGGLQESEQEQQDDMSTEDAKCRRDNGEQEQHPSQQQDSAKQGEITRRSVPSRKLRRPKRGMMPSDQDSHGRESDEGLQSYRRDQGLEDSQEDRPEDSQEHTAAKNKWRGSASLEEQEQEQQCGMQDTEIQGDVSSQQEASRQKQEKAQDEDVSSQDDAPRHTNKHRDTLSPPPQAFPSAPQQADSEMSTPPRSARGERQRRERKQTAFYNPEKIEEENGKHGLGGESLPVQARATGGSASLLKKTRGSLAEDACADATPTPVLALDSLSSCEECCKENAQLIEARRLAVCFTLGHLLVDVNGDAPRACRNCRQRGRDELMCYRKGHMSGLTLAQPPSHPSTELFKEHTDVSRAAPCLPRRQVQSASQAQDDTASTSAAGGMALDEPKMLDAIADEAVMPREVKQRREQVAKEQVSRGQQESTNEDANKSSDRRDQVASTGRATKRSRHESLSEAMSEFHPISVWEQKAAVHRARTRCERLVHDGIPSEDSKSLGPSRLLVDELLACIARDDVAGCRRLIERGVDVNAKDAQLHTPLHVAAAKGNVEVALALIAAGADARARSINGDEPLHIAASQAKMGVVDLLSSRGGSLDRPNNERLTPRHLVNMAASTMAIAAPDPH